MVRMHSLAMSGGVLDAVESLTVEERGAALDGYRFFGLNAAAEALADIVRRFGDGGMQPDEAETLEIEADERYANVVPDDGVLVQAFQARYERDPSAFAALG
jgi:hypothetical protein